MEGTGEVAVSYLLLRVIDTCTQLWAVAEAAAEPAFEDVLVDWLET